jgi:hypothetical protein
MKSIVEKRRDPRIPVSMPVVLMTSKGTIKGKTVNLSVSGLGLLLLPETREIDDEFQITLKLSDDHIMPLTCEKIWSDKIIFDGSFHIGIGVRFTKISSKNRQILASKVAEYFLV